MTSPLRRKRPTTPRNSPASSIRAAELARWAHLLGRDKRACLSKAPKHMAKAAIGMLTIFSLSVAAVRAADDSVWPATNSSSWTVSGSNTAGAINRPAKLQWKPVRPQRNDGSIVSRDSGDSTKPAVNNRSDVFDDAAPARSSIKLVGSNENPKNSTVDQDEFLNSALKDPFFDDSPAGKSRRPASSQTTGPESLPPTREAPPPLKIDADPAQRMPPELMPTDPIRSASMHRTQASPIEPPSPIVPAQPDLLPGDNQPGQPPHSAEEDCREDYKRVKALTLNKLSIDISVTGDPGADIPFECSLSTDPFAPRCWRLTTYTWKASALCHKPLYFEDEALERYGHSHGPFCEYLASGAHFFGDLILLPYHMGVETPCECIYDLGVYRVGDCAPYMLDPFPISCRGLVTGAIGYCGVAALLP